MFLDYAVKVVDVVVLDFDSIWKKIEFKVRCDDVCYFQNIGFNHSVIG